MLLACVLKYNCHIPILNFNRRSFVIKISRCGKSMPEYAWLISKRFTFTGKIFFIV